MRLRGGAAGEQIRLTDAQYERIAPLLPTPRGKLTVLQRQLIYALFYIVSTLSMVSEPVRTAGTSLSASITRAITCPHCPPDPAIRPTVTHSHGVVLPSRTSEVQPRIAINPRCAQLPPNRPTRWLA